MIVDTVDYMNKAIKKRFIKVIAEGANATMLDIDFGTYPYTTSSSTTVGGVCTGLGVPPQAIETTIGVIKAYTTRVGGGPFPTELQNEIGENLRTVGQEFGATTGRPRRCGWLDLNAVKYSQKINRFSSFNLTKLDVLTGLDTIKVATEYKSNKTYKNGSIPTSLKMLEKAQPTYVELKGWKEDISKCTSFDQLPENAKAYVNFIESELKVPITWIGVGPQREAMIRKDIEVAKSKRGNPSLKKNVEEAK